MKKRKDFRLINELSTKIRTLKSLVIFFLLAIILAISCFTQSVIIYAEEKESDDVEQESDSGAVDEPQSKLPGIERKEIVVVIDPGHGGENLGGEYEDYTEKELTLVTANAMKEELEKYEGITVYMTRTGDQKLSLDERCAFAESVDADFLFCLHYNLSEYHTLFGAECWVSAFGENYSKGYSFASVEIDMLQELGLYSRGIKTRLNDKGTDYYGILRHSVERNIPCVLIEHCHLDQINDQPFVDHDEKLKDFGRLDATAVAKYFNLKSEALGVDYSNYENVEVPVPSYVVAPDRTEPDICMIEVLDQNVTNGEVTVEVTAADYDSGMLYYTYSYDNGETFSELQRWPDKSADIFTFTMQVPPHLVPQIVVNGYNGYDLYTTSNVVSLPSMDYKTEEEIAAELARQEALASASEDVASEANTNVSGKTGNTNISEKIQGTNRRELNRDEDEKQPVSLSYFLTVCGVCALLVLGMVISMILILRGRKRISRGKS